MRVISWILAACMALAVLRMAVVALLIAMSALLLWGAVYYPRQIIGFLMVSVAVGLMQLHPVISLAILGMGALLYKDD